MEPRPFGRGTHGMSDGGPALVVELQWSRGPSTEEHDGDGGIAVGAKRELQWSRGPWTTEHTVGEPGKEEKAKLL